MQIFVKLHYQANICLSRNRYPIISPTSDTFLTTRQDTNTKSESLCQKLSSFQLISPPKANGEYLRLSDEFACVSGFRHAFTHFKVITSDQKGDGMGGGSWTCLPDKQHNERLVGWEVTNFQRMRAGNKSIF